MPRAQQQYDHQRQRSADILWLVPDKPENISTGRQRIASGLEALGYGIVQEPRELAHVATQARAKYDAVIGTTSAGGILTVASRLRDTPVIIDHVDPVSQTYETSGQLAALCIHALENLAFRLADGVMYVYEGEAERVMRRADRWGKTRLGVDYGRFAAPSGTAQDKAHVMLSSHGVTPGYALYVGGLEPIYNIEPMCEAFEYTDTDLVIAGTGSQQDVVERYADDLNNVTYLGVVDHATVPGLMHPAGVGLSLVDDPQTVKVLEYAAAGLPIVHAEGRARGELPGCVKYTRVHPREIAAVVDHAKGREIDTAQLQAYAEQHDYERIITEYDTAIQHVL